MNNSETTFKYETGKIKQSLVNQCSLGISDIQGRIKAALSLKPGEGEST